MTTSLNRPSPCTAGSLDLSAAAKLVRDDCERARWLTAMQESAGMAPGPSRSAHARAFRFAEALRRAGYTVTESASGPRGGRRFTLDAFAGTRAGQVYRLQEHSACSWDHSRTDCDCFDVLDDGQLGQLAKWHRRLRKTWGRVHSTNELVPLLVRYDDETRRVATDLYVESASHQAPLTTLEELLAAVQVAMES